MEGREGHLQDRDRSVPSFVGKVSEETIDVSRLGQEDWYQMAYACLVCTLVRRRGYFGGIVRSRWTLF